MPTKHDNCQTCDRPECDRAIVYTVGGPVPACAGLAVDWRTRAITAERLLADERAAHAETSRDLDALLTALGAQVTPGGQTLDACEARRVADGMRRAKRAAEVMRRAIELLGVSAPAAPATVARPISEWHEDRGSALWWRFPVEEPPYSGSPLDSDWPGYHTHWTPIVCPDDPPSESPAAPATVGGLLATAPIGAFVEWLSEDHEGWCRTTVGQSQMVISRWFEYPPKWTRPGFGMYPGDLRLPARLVPADQADADPASRGPIGGGS